MSKKTLFICTKPYQYLICRLIIKGYNYSNSDIIVLNHFEGAKEFSFRLKKLKIWNSVYFFDDSKLNRYSNTLNIFQKLFFYNRWNNLVPQLEINYDEYDKLYFAHEGVATEYGIMRYFKMLRNKTIIYEEGYGNYVNINTHNFIKSFLKEMAYLFNIPGSYIGRTKFVDKILLQYPEMVVKNSLPIAKKVDKLPTQLKDFINCLEIQEELYKLFPDILKLPKQEVSGVSLFLGEPFLSDLIKSSLIKNIIEFIRNDSCFKNMIFLKQHPGETKDYPIFPLDNIIMIPKIVPIELFSIYLCKNNIKSLCIYTFGSAAAINLYFLVKNTCNVKVVLLKSDEISYNYKLACERFEKLIQVLKIKYSHVQIS